MKKRYFIVHTIVNDEPLKINCVDLVLDDEWAIFMEEKLFIKLAIPRTQIVLIGETDATYNSPL